MEKSLFKIIQSMMKKFKCIDTFAAMAMADNKIFGFDINIDNFKETVPNMFLNTYLLNYEMLPNIVMSVVCKAAEKSSSIYETIKCEFGESVSNEIIDWIDKLNSKDLSNCKDIHNAMMKDEDTLVPYIVLKDCISSFITCKQIIKVMNIKTLDEKYKLWNSFKNGYLFKYLEDKYKHLSEKQKRMLVLIHVASNPLPEDLTFFDNPKIKKIIN